MFKHLSVNELAQLKARVFDIRDGQSYSSGHIPNAQWVNNENAAQVFGGLDKNEPIVVCCYHGNSSQSAAAYLVEQGFVEVYSLDGGFEHWRQTFPEQISTSQG